MNYHQARQEGLTIIEMRQEGAIHQNTQIGNFDEQSNPEGLYFQDNQLVDYNEDMLSHLSEVN